MYVKNQQGKTKRLSVKNNIKRNQFINLNNITNYDDSTYDELERQGTLKHEQVQRMTKNRIIVPIPGGMKAAKGSNKIQTEEPTLADDLNTSSMVDNDRDEDYHLEELLLNGIKSYSAVYQHYLDSKGLVVAKKDHERRVSSMG